ncbi:hypothetical protein ATK23_0233 [Glutamicibacter mysorens]|uniref:Uncharacterized protein n=1 Tax=Glutamicibacter mysorens TaxID=257984 RepID=A0ABX4MZJ2_9MICC|nr:DUF5719 family protein [Glutamicibacter mysorens]PJJ43062.1 hypothetical protein ATK23_0233 [Glutamicibacter mysorens]
MSDEKNVDSADSADQPTAQTPAPKPVSAQPEAKDATPVSATLSRAEAKAAKARAKVDAKLEKARAKEAQARAKTEAKEAAKAAKAEPKAAEQEDPKPEQLPEADSGAKDSKVTSPAAVLADEQAESKRAAQEQAPKPDSVQDGSAKDDSDKTSTVAPEAAPAKPATAGESAAGKTDAAANPEPVAKPDHVAEAEPAKEESATAVAGNADSAPAREAEPKTSSAQDPEAGAAAAAVAAAGKAKAGDSQSGEEAATAQEPEDPKAAKRRQKLEKVRARKAAKAAPAAASTAAHPAAEPEAEPADGKVAERRHKLDKARTAASKDAVSAPVRKKTGAVLLSLAAVVAAGAVVGAGSIFAPAPAEKSLPAAVTNLPAGDSSSVCPGTPQLLKGVEGTDAQFAPGAKDVSSNLRSIAVSDLAKRIPGSSFTKLDGSDARQLTERIAEDEAAEARGADEEGLTGRASKISTANDIDDTQVYTLQPLGQLASKGSALRSYQAKDGDLAGLAAATCQAPASNWRFTGLQTSTGSTSVMHLANPTHTTAQVSLRLRGPDGLIDTSTLQNIVLAAGESRAIVLGGYAQDLNSISAEVTSLGGKITASVQQAALRGLTPSGVELVGANATASNSQVIPGVWIESKENVSKLSKDDKSLVPQLHVSATGSSGAGFKVKVLGADGEVAASFDENLAVDSDATKVVNLNQLAGGYYTVVVESDAPVTAAVKMVRGADPKDSSDTAWAASSNVLAGTQAMPLSANGTGKFAIAAVAADSAVEAVVVNKDGKLEDPEKLQIKAGQSIVFDPKSVSDDAQAVIFSTDANAYLAQLVLGSDRSIAWAAMPQANAGRDGIVVNIGG